MVDVNVATFLQSLTAGLPEAMVLSSKSLTVVLHVMLTFYRAMHFSANARSWDRMSSVRLSVCNVGDL